VTLLHNIFASFVDHFESARVRARLKFCGVFRPWIDIDETNRYLECRLLSWSRQRWRIRACHRKLVWRTCHL